MNKHGLLPGAVLAMLLLAGCGGGGGGSQLVPNSKAVSPAVRAHVVATTRVARGMFIVAGIGKHITRAPSGRPIRFQRILEALKHHREAMANYDSNTGLYNNDIVNDDGSGHQDLYTDQAHQKPAGSFTWTAPQWFNGVPDRYPSQIGTTYEITGGNLAGNKGTMLATIKDPDFMNGAIHLEFQDAQGELGIADFTIVNGLLSSKDTITLADRVIFHENDKEQDDGSEYCAIDYPDGGTGVIVINPDGTDQETYTDPSGTVESTGTIQDNGDGTIQYDDGSTDNVNVDTGDETSSDNSDNSDSSSSGDGKKVRKLRSVPNGSRLILPKSAAPAKTGNLR